MQGDAAWLSRKSKDLMEYENFFGRTEKNKLDAENLDMKLVLTIAIFYLHQFHNILEYHGVFKLSVLGETWRQMSEQAQNVYRFHSVVKSW